MNQAALNIQKFYLPHGATLQYVHRELPSFVIRVVFEGAVFAEPEGRNGLAALSARMLLEGTRHYTGIELADELDGLGVEWSMGGTSLQMTVLSSRQNEVARLLGQILSEPRLLKEDFDRTRKEMVEDLGRGLEESETLAQEILRRHLFAGTLATRHPAGTPRELETIELREVKQFLATYMAGRSLKFYVAGNVDIAEFLQCLQPYLEMLPEGQFPLPPPKIEPVQPPRRIFVYKDRQQSAVLLGHPGIRRHIPEYQTLRVADGIFGQACGLTTRLAQRLREDLGLCYSVGGEMTGSAGRMPGIFQMGLGTADATVEIALRELLNCMREFVEKGPGRLEVSDSRSFLLGSLCFATETCSSVVQLLRELDIYGFPSDFLKRESEAMEKIQVEDVHAAVCKFWKPEALSSVVIGRSCPAGFESIEPAELVGMARKGDLA